MSRRNYARPLPTSRSPRSKREEPGWRYAELTPLGVQELQYADHRRHAMGAAAPTATESWDKYATSRSAPESLREPYCVGFHAGLAAAQARQGGAR